MIILEYIKLNIIVAIIIFVVICLVSVIGYLIYKYSKLQDEYYARKKEHLRRANQISMIEYQYKNYKEGTNAYTVLRDIGEILHK